MLGRLNGKSEAAIEKIKKVRSELKTNLYIEQRYGPMRFVSGGLVESDPMKYLNGTTLEKPEGEQHVAVEKHREKRSKKRKEGSNDEELQNSTKKHKKQKRLEEELQTTEKGPRKRKKESRELPRNTTSEPTAVQDEPEKKHCKRAADAATGTESAATTVARDEEKTKKKKEKKDKRLSKHKGSSKAESLAQPAVPKDRLDLPSTATSSDNGPGSPAPQALATRHLVRSRNIAHKRLALADVQALNQVSALS